MKIVRHLEIYGRVQGVFFRETMARRAQSLHVTGWVRNRLDGSVEAMVQGSEEAVAAIVEWARHGPELARVDRVDVEEGWGDYATFEKQRTL